MKRNLHLNRSHYDLIRPGHLFIAFSIFNVRKKGLFEKG